MAEELTLHVKLGNQWRSLPEPEFLREIAELKRNNFADARKGPVTIEATDERGRVCWRGYYRDLEAVAREFMDQAGGRPKP
jgi:hypothetical protein